MFSKKPVPRYLKTRQNDEKECDLSHAIRFFEVCRLKDQFLHCIGSKKLAPDWELALDAFKTSVKEFLRPCKHIGKHLIPEFQLLPHSILGILYYHVLEHMRDFCKETKQSPGLSCNDQVNQHQF